MSPSLGKDKAVSFQVDGSEITNTSRYKSGKNRNVGNYANVKTAVIFAKGAPTKY